MNDRQLPTLKELLEQIRQGKKQRLRSNQRLKKLKISLEQQKKSENDL